MAYTTGETANYRTMLAVVRDFLTSDASLVAAGQAWAQIGGQTGSIGVNDFVSLQGPGLAGDDQILLSLQTFTNVPSAQYCIGISGHTAYAPSVPRPDPPGLNSPWVYMPLIDSAIRYWLVANGRRFILVTKSNSRYDVMYGGLVMPDHLPSDWPYPVLAAASSSVLQAGSSDLLSHSNFWRSLRGGYLFTPEQLWRPLENLQTTGGNPNNGSEFAPDSGRLMAADWKTNIGPSEFARTLDNQPWIRRGRLAQFGNDDISARNFLGHFDGVYFTPAIGAVVESEIEIGTDRYLVVPNVYRSTVGQMAAIHLE